jgi:polyisoprenoid-binding protein YceI
MLAAAGLAPAQPAAPPRSEQIGAIDPARSSFIFEIRTRLGQRIHGVFPHLEGEVVQRPDGSHLLRLRMPTHDVNIPGRPRYTAWIRGEDFFDVENFPLVTFESEPAPPQVISAGGKVSGKLTIRGTTHAETMRLIAAECPRAGYDCDVISQGTIQRGRYGMDGWQMALGDRVTFTLRVRLTAPSAL